MTNIALLDAEIRTLMAAGVGEHDDERFNDLALRAFEYQFRRNEAYARFCERRGAAPASVGDWRQIPAVPTTAFKHLPLTTFPPAEAETVYRTSGTTQGPELRGAHYIRDISLYEASLRPNLAAHLFPDGGRMPIYVLFWPPEALPNSSLAHMIKDALGRHGAPDSAYLLSERGLDHARLAAALDHAVAAGEPICLMGVAYSFIHFIDACLADGRRWRLPPGSRLMDTGGSKGRAREVVRGELYELYQRIFGLPSTACVNEYGMTELGSQFYDSSLRDAQRGEWRPRHKVVPPWVRTLVVDPGTLEPLEAGQAGLLRHIDLANLYSVCAVQTEDLGIAIGPGFEVLGRASGAELRGCSLAVADVLDAQRNGHAG